MKTQKDLKRSRRKGVKVVYISSPMKVKTSASEFRALVQELTGINSDAERFMEINGVVGDKSSNYHRHHDDDDDHHQDQRLVMKTEVEDYNYNENDDQFPYFPIINPTGFCDFPVSSSEYSPLIPLQTFGNDQSIFS